jgi:hypothetical protein
VAALVGVRKFDVFSAAPCGSRNRERSLAGGDRRRPTARMIANVCFAYGYLIF